MINLDNGVAYDKIIIERLVAIESRLEVLQEKLEDNRTDIDKCILSLREDVRPVIEFYDKIETLGILGRAILVLVGMLLAMAAAIATVLRFVKGTP